MSPATSSLGCRPAAGPLGRQSMHTSSFIVVYGKDSHGKKDDEDNGSNQDEANAGQVRDCFVVLTKSLSPVLDDPLADPLSLRIVGLSLLTCPGVGASILRPMMLCVLLQFSLDFTQILTVARVRITMPVTTGSHMRPAASRSSNVSGYHYCQRFFIVLIMKATLVVALLKLTDLTSTTCYYYFRRCQAISLLLESQRRSSVLERSYILAQLGVGK